MPLRRAEHTEDWVITYVHAKDRAQDCPIAAVSISLDEDAVLEAGLKEIERKMT